MEWEVTINLFIMEEKLKQELSVLINDKKYEEGYELVYSYAKRGIPQDRMKSLLMELRDKFSYTESVEVEDFFTGVLDRVVGFCPLGTGFYE